MELRWPKRKADHSPESNTEVKNAIHPLPQVSMAFCTGTTLYFTLRYDTTWSPASMIQSLLQLCYITNMHSEDGYEIEINS
jgi:hypothetical protein